MPLSLSDALRDLRTILGEPQAVQWSDTELTTLLDLGQKHVACLTLGYQRQVTFRNTDATQALLASRREYTPTGVVGAGGLGRADALKVQTLYLGGDELPEVVGKAIPTWDARSTGDGTPAAWYGFAGVLTLLPAPSTAFLASYELVVVYAALPAAWTTGNSVLPEGLADLAIWFAGALAWFSAQKYANALALYARYLQLADAYAPVTVAQPETTKDELGLPSRRPRQTVRG